MQGIAQATKTGSELKTNATSEPFAELGGYVFGDESDLCATTDEFVLWRCGFGRDEGEVGGAVRRRDADPTATSVAAAVEDELKAELIKIEGQTAIDIADEDGDGLEAQIGAGAVEGKDGSVGKKARRTAHAEHYKSGGGKRG